MGTASDAPSLTSGDHKIIDDIMIEIINKLPTGPSLDQVVSKTDKALVPWSIIGEGKTMEIVLPSNLESLADDKMTHVAVAAMKSLGIDKYTVSSEIFTPTVEYSKKVENYLHGVMWALSGKGKLLKYQETSGSMGHGYYFVAHQALEQLNGGTFWVKGSPWNPMKGITGKAWCDTISISERKIISLISKACKSLDVRVHWATYFRAPESFLGNELKKTLPHKKVGILTQDESDVLELIYKHPIELYHKALQTLKDPQLEHLPVLASALKGVGSAIQPLCTLVDEIISYRTSFIYSSDKKKRKAQLKTPVKDLINGMSLEAYIKAFDPMVLGGLKPFKLQEDLDFENPEVVLAVRNSYIARIESIKSNQGLKPLYDLSKKWATATFATS